MKDPEQLAEGLKDMLILTETSSGNENEGIYTARNPLIQVIHDEPADHELNGEVAFGDDVSDDDGDDAPPPIYFHGHPPAHEKKDAADQAGNAKIEEGAESKKEPPMTVVASKEETAAMHSSNCATSLAEQLFADADVARRAQSSRQAKERRRQAKKATFGFQKGFLDSSVKSNSALKSKNSRPSRKINPSIVDKIKETPKSDLIYELDGEGNMVPSSLDPSPKSAGASSGSSDIPVLDQVQQTVQDRIRATSDEWATPSLLETIQKHPKLAKGLNNPKYTAILQSMQTHPKQTMEKLRKEMQMETNQEAHEMMEFLNEFCAVMGNHFVKLGEDQEREASKNNKHSDSNGNASKSGAKVREMGPLEERALRMHKQKEEQSAKSQIGHESKQKNMRKVSKSSAGSASPTKKSEDERQMDQQVSNILANDELRSILLDPKMQHVMQECTQDMRKFRMYMNDGEFRPKLQKLMEAGLLRLA